jgi:ribose-phosphate pyrophosphokinase
MPPRPPPAEASNGDAKRLRRESFGPLGDPHKKYLYYCPQMKSLADAIASQPSSLDIRTREISWKKFPDGFPNLFVEGAEDIRGKHVAFLASFNNPETIFEQISVIYSLPKMFIASFTLILPFFPTGTAERVDREGEIPTAVTLARILSHIPLSRGGPTSTIVFDIHALQERFYFGDNITPCFETAIPLLLQELAKMPDAKDVVIAYPDEGAMKRFHTMFDGFDEVVCTKVRKGAERLVTLKEGEPRGKHVVIVDDLVQSGGTLIECGKVLLENGADKISAFCTHGVFPNDKHERFTGSDMFENFWITDSCPQTVARVEGKRPFKVLSLAGRIAQALEF